VTPRCRKAKNSRHPSPMESFLGNTYSASELKLTSRAGRSSYDMRDVMIDRPFMLDDMSLVRGRVSADVCDRLVSQRLLPQARIAPPCPPPRLHSAPALGRLLPIRLKTQLHEVLLVGPLVRVSKHKLLPHAHNLAHFPCAIAAGLGEGVGRVTRWVKVVWRRERGEETSPE